MPDGGRAARMATSVSAALRGRGLPPSDQTTVLDALGCAMVPRERLLVDDHHPAFLHPGRSILIILHDVRDRTGHAALALAALHESRDDELRVEAGDAARVVGGTLAEALAGLPRPGQADLAEELVLLERPAALAVVAEQLDHLRHLHLRDDLAPDRAAVCEEVAHVWGPFAERVDPRLGVRFAHWLRTFRRRLRTAARLEEPS